MSDPRKIIHIDMDAFYASVEQLDQPHLRGKPLAVGGLSEKRGVIAAASYEARKYGVRSAMPTAEAFRRCPVLNLVPPRFPRYREISNTVHGIFRCYTDLIEPVALDEAWLDVSSNFLSEPSGTRIAQRIKADILQQTSLTCSAGVSYNKFLAKIASEENKPDGLFVITPEQAPAFLNDLHVRKIPGVGKVTEEKLRSLGIEITGEILTRDAEWLQQNFCKFGMVLYQRARGVDHRPVEAERESKSVSVESTFDRNLTNLDDLTVELDNLIEKLHQRLSRHGINGSTLTLKLKFSDFEQITRSESRGGLFDRASIIETGKRKLLQCCTKEFSGRPVRLIGIGISNFGNPPRVVQLDFFEELKILV
ncbi:MAG: DNA polymerase IV [SAR324 cluster bacterium]|nr:DNA polymerase IV [SAR324 cluster bacterium]MDP7137388.1 DNA polymerase IV [SAR324 cluster bacterium]